VDHGRPEEATVTEHEYLSTACHHQLHERCRLVCKFCQIPCACECHRAESYDEKPPEEKK
jgi:hypothetical protein